MDDLVKVGNSLIGVASPSNVVHDESLVGNGVTQELGVNVPYIKQLVSDDETVLWEGELTTGTSATFSEPITNFERYIFIGKDSTRGHGYYEERVLNTSETEKAFAISLPDGNFSAANNGYIGWFFTSLTWNDDYSGITCRHLYQKYFNPPNGSASGNDNRGIILTKIIGVGRKGGN